MAKSIKKSEKNSKSSVKATSKSSSKNKIKAKADAAKNLDDLYEDGLKDILWAEKNLLKALPKMEKNATHSTLKKAISKHLKETENHISRLEECFKEIDKKPKAEKCDAMAGLLEEAKGIMEETEAGTVRDAGIIAAAQKVEHYEIATYGTLAAFAKILGHKKGLKQLLQTLAEEKKCDEDLSQIADTNLNSKAK
jgi:ferritin-like metal-binding protein YciE